MRPSVHPLAVACPAVEFPVTLCVVAFGAHVELSRWFLNSLYRYTPSELFQLRVGLNEVEPATVGVFREYQERFGNLTIFNEPTNVFKSPLMRRMFHSPAIETKWTVWCDDDARFTRPDWLQRLCLKIEGEPEVAMWGKKYWATQSPEQVQTWIENAAWFKGLPLETTVSGNDRLLKFSFVTGGFWAIRTDVLRKLDWPDRRLVQALDDLMLGEALRQNGLKSGMFNYGVEIHEIARRNPEADEVAKLTATPRQSRNAR